MTTGAKVHSSTTALGFATKPPQSGFCSTWGLHRHRRQPVLMCCWHSSLLLISQDEKSSPSMQQMGRV